MFDSPIPDALYDKAYDLAMESCDPEDEEKFDELLESIKEPLLDKEVEFVINSKLESAKNEPEFQEAFKKSVQSIFEETLLSTMESTYDKMTDFMYCEELEKTYNAFTDML